MYVRRTDGMNAMTTGRSVNGLVSRLDDALCVAVVGAADLRAGDEAIDEAMYASDATAIRAYNVANAPPAPVDSEWQTLAAILNKADGDITAGELKQVVLGVLRRMRRQEVLRREF